MIETHRSIETETATAEAALVARCQQGDEEAGYQLFQRYARPVLGFVYDLIGDQAQAEEIMQETFVRAFSKLNNLKDYSKFSSWLFGIARNTVREAIKEKYQALKQVALDEPITLQLTSGEINPDDQLQHMELNQAIQTALQALPDDWRTVFALKVFQQFSYEEIVQITGWSLAKVKTDLHRARQQMQRSLAAHWP